MCPIIVLLLAMLGPTAWAACPSSNEALRDHLDMAALAFAGNHTAVLANERAAAEAELACLDTQITRENVAAYHQMVALDCSLRGDQDCALSSLRATAATMPGWQIPDSVVPADHALRDLYATASAGRAGDRQLVDVPAGVVLVLDGARGALRPGAEPVVAQAFDAQGQLLWGVWVDIGQDLPAFPRPRQRSPLLMVSAGAVLGASGALWLGARASADQLEVESQAIEANRRGGAETDSTLKDMSDLADRANLLGLAAQVGAGLGVSLGVVALTVKF